MPPKKQGKFDSPKKSSTSKTRRTLIDVPFVTPLQQRQQIQPPANALTTWMSSCPPEFYEQMQQAMANSSSTNNISSQASHYSEALPDECNFQNEVDNVETQFEDDEQTQHRSSYVTPTQPRVRNNQKGGKGKQAVDETMNTKRNYTKPEDELLCQIYSNISDKCVEDRKNKFWMKITNAFNEETQDEERTKASLVNRWGRLKRVARAWKAACLKVDGTYHSGWSESMILESKKQEYCAFTGEKEFVFEHIVEHLVNFSKYSWDTADVPSFNDESRRTPESGGSGKRSFDAMNEDIDEEGDEVEEVEVEVSSPVKKTPQFSKSYATMRRPDGVKMTKAKEKAAREASSQFQSMDAELTQRIAVEQERDFERMQLAAQKLSLQKETEQRRRMEAETKTMQALFETAKTEEDLMEAQAFRKAFVKKYHNF